MYDILKNSISCVLIPKVENKINISFTRKDNRCTDHEQARDDQVFDIQYYEQILLVIVFIVMGNTSKLYIVFSPAIYICHRPPVTVLRKQ